MIETEVVLNIETMKLWRREISSQLSSSSDNGGRFVAVYKQWAVRYRSFIQLRFDQQSRGGGEWRELAPSTIASRRKNSSTILRDTGALFAALAPVWNSPPGGINELIEGGVKVGFGGPAAHPGGIKTIAEIAAMHQTGGGKLPKREIIVTPPSHVIDAMAEDLQRALNA
jgi:hypothetical protein